MSHRVVLYTGAGWLECDDAKRFFSRHGIPYELRDLELPAVLEELKALTKGRVSTPTILLDDELFLGYAGNEGALQAALGIAAFSPAPSPAAGSGMLAVLDPIGDVDTLSIPAAPRLSDLAGAVIGVIDNGKWNVEPFLRQLYDLLHERYGVRELIYRTKPHFSKPAPDDTYAELAGQAQAVLIGIGDWGSCTSCSVHDAVAFEQRGIPALPVLTDVFVSEARRKAGYLSFPDLPLVVVDHPFSALTPEQIRGRAVQALPQVVAGLTGRGQQGGR